MKKATAREESFLFDLFIRACEIKWDKIPEGSYLRDIEALQGLERIAFESRVTFLVGENGTGKSTLLEALALALGFNAEGGTRNYHFSTYDTHSELHDALFIERGPRQPAWGYFLRAESFYNVATAEREEYAGAEFLHARSHGESFLKVVQKHFKPGGLYLLDEPEAAFSPQRQLSLLLELYRCQKSGGQIIAVTHSPILLSLPGAQILSMDGSRLHPVAWEETESVRLYSLFLDHRDQVLSKLLSDD